MKTKNFREYLLERFDEKTIQEIEAQADVEAENLKSLQEEVSKAVVAYMSEQKIGFNELVKRLGTSPSQIAKSEAPAPKGAGFVRSAIRFRSSLTYYMRSSRNALSWFVAPA